MHKSLIFLLSFFVVIGVVHTQNIVNLLIEPETGSAGYIIDVVERNDGYYAAGYLQFVDHTELWVLRIDYSGNIIWQKKFNRDGVNAAGNPYTWISGSISLSQDGDCYVLGRESSYLGLGINEYRGFVVKINASGDLLWKTYIGIHGITGESDMITDSDNNVVVVGHDIDFVLNIGKLVKLNSSGTVLFTEQFKSDEEAILSMNTIAETADHHYAIAGFQRTDWDRDRAVVFKVSKLGSLIWKNVYFSGKFAQGDSTVAYPLSICASKDSSIWIAGEARKSSIGNSQGFLLKCSQSGLKLESQLVLADKFPGDVNDNLISWIYEKSDKLYFQFDEGYDVKYGINLHLPSGAILQQGYSTNPLRYQRNIKLINRFGQPVFAGGGEVYFGSIKYGLLLVTTEEGLWLPPEIKSIETNNDYPLLVSSTGKHIGIGRLFQLSKTQDFASIEYEKAINSDSTLLDFRKISNGTYYIRLANVGQYGNRVFSAAEKIEFNSEYKYRFAGIVYQASSEYSPTDYSASQVKYAPNVYPRYGDFASAWASSTADGRREFLHLGYDFPSKIKGVAVFETYYPGAVDTVFALNPNTNQWIPLYVGNAAPAPATARIFQVNFSPTDFKVSQIRVAINSPAVPGYNEIDAIGLIDVESVNQEDIHGSEINFYTWRAGNKIYIEFDNALSAQALCELYSLTGVKLLSRKIQQGEKMIILEDTDELSLKVVKLYMSRTSQTRLTY
ncbi:MAG: hypothetical protein IPM34_06815 [Saprospiraceae bacterium]|nr:hypothetical protein [Saprospiraceae bacterium]